jgi:serine/threonine protein kinase
MLLNCHLFSPSCFVFLFVLPVDNRTRRLGTGAFGEAYKCTHPQKVGRFVVKRIRKPTEDEAADNPLDWKIELNTMKKVQSPYVVTFIEDWEDMFCGYIVMEYCDGGTLRKRMNQRFLNGGSFEEQEIWSYLAQLAKGLADMHSANITHRDLKPENVFMTKGGQLKIGLSPPLPSFAIFSVMVLCR